MVRVPMDVSELARAWGMIVHACQPNAMDYFCANLFQLGGDTRAGLGPSFAPCYSAVRNCRRAPLQSGPETFGR
jgi:hypothetical protein